MRILFSSTPAFGHLLPMMPLATAAASAGHEVAVLTNAQMAQVAHPLRLLPAGPTLTDVMAEVVRTTGTADQSIGPEAAYFALTRADLIGTLAEYFAGARVKLGIDESLAQARLYNPDLIVAETVDFVGQIAAAELGVPWANHGFGMELAGPLIEAMNETAAHHYVQRGCSPAPRLAYLDPCPDILQQDDWTAPADRITIRPQAFSQEGSGWSIPSFPGREDLPLVLLTLGTVVDDPDALLAMLASVTAAADVNIVVTFGSQDRADASDVDRSRILPVGFVPLDQLLQGVSLVVSAGGAGTVLATLSRGLPLVLLPMIVDQTWNAERAEAAGTAVVVASPQETGGAVQKVLADPTYRAAARQVAGLIAQMDPPAQVLGALQERIAQR